MLFEERKLGVCFHADMVRQRVSLDSSRIKPSSICQTGELISVPSEKDFRLRDFGAKNRATNQHCDFSFIVT